MSVERETPSAAGCWLEGHRGWTAIPALVRIAEGYGMVLSSDDAAIVSRVGGGDDSGDDWECMHDIADDAEQWLTEHVAPEGYSFGWHDGEFFLWLDEDWQEV